MAPADDGKKPSNGFLFIDYQDISSQGTVLRKRKHAFLQRKYHQQQREERLGRLKSSVCPFPNRPVTTLVDVHMQSKDRLKEDRSSSSNQEREDKDKDVSSALWSLHGAFDSGVLDPFSSLAISMTGDMDLYFDYYRDACVRSCYPFGATAMSIWWWQKAIEQPALLHIILSTSAYHKGSALIDGGDSSLAVRKYLYDSFHFRAKTIKALQQLLDSATKSSWEPTALIIGHLICVEGACANVEAVDAHIKGLKKLVDLLGGLEALDHTTISTIYCGVYMRGVMNGGSPPAFPMSRKWRSEVLEGSQVFRWSPDLLRYSSIGCRFFFSSWCSDLHPSMISLLHLFRGIVIYHENTKQESSVVLPIDNDMLLLASHRLLSANYTDFQETLRLAMLIYATLRIWTFKGLPCIMPAVTALRASLETNLRFLQSTACDLLFWILFTGGLASKGYPQHQWFVVQLAEAAQQLSLTNWDSTLLLLQGFFFIHQPNEKPPLNLWNAVLRHSQLEDI